MTAKKKKSIPPTALEQVVIAPTNIVESANRRIFVNLTNCARCQGDHGRVIFRPFTVPMLIYTHWALCPTNGEPVILAILRNQPSNPDKDHGSEQDQSNP